MRNVRIVLTAGLVVWLCIMALMAIAKAASAPTDEGRHQMTANVGAVSAIYAIKVNSTSCKLVGDGNVGTVTFPTDTLSVGIIPRNSVTANGYLQLGSVADPNFSTQIPSGGVIMPMTKAVADTIRIIGDANFLADVWVISPR